MKIKDYKIIHTILPSNIYSYNNKINGLRKNKFNFTI